MIKINLRDIKTFHIFRLLMIFSIIFFSLTNFFMFLLLVLPTSQPFAMNFDSIQIGMFISKITQDNIFYWEINSFAIVIFVFVILFSLIFVINYFYEKDRFIKINYLKMFLINFICFIIISSFSFMTPTFSSEISSVMKKLNNIYNYSISEISGIKIINLSLNWSGILFTILIPLLLIFIVFPSDIIIIRKMFNKKEEVILNE